MDAKTINKIPLFFIMGSPRSGTTMLQQILDGSPNLIVPLEAHFLVEHKRKYFKKKTWTKENVNEFIDELAVDTKFTLAWEMNVDLLRAECHRIPLSEMTFELMCKVIYLNYPSIYNKQEIRFIGDKNPENVMHLDLLRDVFPNAKIIHIVRDYRANIISNRKWFPRKNIFILSQKWKLFNLYIEKHKRKNPALFYTIRYEDLVDNPEKYSKEICDFIGIAFLPEMLNFHKGITEKYLGDTEKSTLNEYHVRMLGSLHENLVKPINREKVDSWKQEMTKREVIVADYVAGGFAKKYGYQKETNSWNFRLFFFGLVSGIRFRMDVFIIREYYNLPLWTRPVLRFVSEKLYDWFGIVHIYNTKYKRKKDLANQTQ